MHKAPHQFQHERITEDLRREITWTIANKMRDPRVPDIVSVTEIKLADDNRNATVFVSVYGTESEKKGALIALNRACPYIQKVVAERVSMRHFPKLLFKIDDSLDRGMKINELLKEIQDDLV